MFNSLNNKDAIIIQIQKERKKKKEKTKYLSKTHYTSITENLIISNI